MSANRNRLNFSWLIKLRWSSIAGQLATILGVHLLFEISLPLIPLFGIVVIEALSNLGCAMWYRGRSTVEEWQLEAVMALDVLLLTGLLYLTGGPFNPFSFLYLVNISLAAVVLPAARTWTLVVLSLACFGLLFFDYRELLIPGDRMKIMQKGMWVAFGVAAGFIVHFLWRVTHALEAQTRELSDAQKRADRQERLASLATMAAGAAHELATPLGTIALVAKELEHSLVRTEADAEVVGDLRLIREQVARCRLILDQMGGSVGKSGEQGFESITLAELLQESLTGVREKPDVELVVPGTHGEKVLRLPPRAVAQALRGLITNAQDASSEGKSVSLKASVHDDRVEIAVEDRGAGIPPEVAMRVGEPFFTTKDPGRGMGLGVFLSRAIVEKLGGALTMESSVGKGTSVTVSLPVAADVNAVAPSGTTW
jgi:two-component system sensor histidine kinase RegB